MNSEIRVTGWFACTWEGNELASLLKDAQLSPAERAFQREEAYRFAMAILEMRRAMGLPSKLPDGTIVK